MNCPKNDEKDPVINPARQEKLKLLGGLISGITHEINTPMHYLDTNLTFLKYAFKDLSKLLDAYHLLLKHVEAGNSISPDEWQNLHQLEREADSEYLQKEIGLALEQSGEGISLVSRLVLAMKDFSHQAPHSFSLVDVNKCIDTVYTISRHEWKRIADFELRLSRDLPYLYASRDEIHQVLLNLVVNAAHAIAEKIQAGQYDRGNIKAITRIVEDNIEIEIANDGPEISGADIGRIFEPYFTTKEPGKGTGLGLSLVKRIIEKDHGGTIRVSSTTKATSFTLVLPQNRPENEQR